LDRALAIGKWLLQQRNPEGGFISTQDTVVGLTALAKFAMATRSPVNDLEIGATYEGGSEKFSVSNANAIVLQEAFLPDAARNVNLDVKGQGTALATLSWSYYVEQKPADPSFTISTLVSAKTSKAETIELIVSTSFLRTNKPSNMAVMEINLPSGYAFDGDELPELRKIEKVMRYELEDGGTKLQVYFDNLTSAPSTIKLTANRLFKVKNPAKAYIMVYDYYDTTLTATEFYELPLASTTNADDCKSENAVC
jgi:CD109 antigen